LNEGFDLAIRVGPIQESRLVARPLGELEYGWFACPRYLDQRGRPETVNQLRQQSLVIFTGWAQRRGWQLLPDGGTDGEAERIEGPARLRVNNSFSVRDALQRGLGIGLLPLIIAADASRKSISGPNLAHPQVGFGSAELGANQSSIFRQ
jgi:DNA-binding transcriptional LysR family regulator